ncbi:MAG TPA: hypothetical protein VE089_10185 [Nitrososphaeraceae archaeon]|nr:hypothetical protein [Nitrososphaeraceae archaeon]
MSLHLSLLIVSAITLTGLFLLHSVTGVLAQQSSPTPPQLNIKDQNSMSLNGSEAIYNANTSKSLGSKNLTLTPYRTTEEHYFEHGFFKGIGYVTNNQTFRNTYLSDKMLVGRGNGTFETRDGQNINWVSSDLGRSIDDGRWVFYGILLFNNTNSKSLSILNNSIALSKSTSGLKEPEYIWLLK